MKDTTGLFNIGQLVGYDRALGEVHRLMEFIGEPSYVIAGGFVRDTLLGRPYKDIDVFLPNKDEKITQGHDEEIQYELSDTIDVELSGFHINVIRLGWHCVSVKDVLERMDTGICQAAVLTEVDQSDFLMSVKTSVYATPAFIDDIAYKRITIMRPDLGERSNHIPRLREKFPDWPILNGPIARGEP